jgi:hypothetical protein
MSESYYDVAQICLNGHLITDMASSYPQHQQAYCAKCGKPTIVACPSCSESIKGYYHVDGVFLSHSHYQIPFYCIKCGKTFPWTSEKLNAARELVQEAEFLNPEEQTQLISTFEDIIADSPKTQVAANRASRLMKKAGSTVAGILRDIFVDIASEAAKKILMP